MHSVRHVAIIMDGNGRWALLRGLPRIDGHKAGVDAAQRALEAAYRFNISYLTLYTFSSENWGREYHEIDTIFGIAKRIVTRDRLQLHKKHICFRSIGRKDRIPKDLLDALEELETLTKDNNKMTLTLAIDYGGRDEIFRAAVLYAQSTMRSSINSDKDIFSLSMNEFSRYLWTKDLPDPDLIIRTSGECRLSNFLLWQASYAEIIVLNKFWPDFQESDLEQSLLLFQKRQRRFGVINGIERI